MLILTTSARSLSTSEEELEKLAEWLDLVGMTKVCSATQADWTDDDVSKIRRFLDGRGIGVAEFSSFPRGLGSPDPQANREGLETYRRYLRHARLLGAHCVGFSFTGLYGQKDPRSEEYWGLVVEATRQLAQEAEAQQMNVAVHPHVMGPVFSVQRIRRLMEEVNSPSVKVLIDPVNLVTVDTFYQTTALLHQIFDELGPWIVAAHAKDVVISGPKMGRFQTRGETDYLFSVTHLDEEIPGRGNLDYATFLRGLNDLGRDITVNLEHLRWNDEVIVARHYVSYVARKTGIQLS